MNIPKEWVEAGARGMCDVQNKARNSWDFESESMRDVYRAEATACLSAVFGKAEVVWKNESGESRFAYSHGLSSDPLAEVKPGDTLVIVRGW